VDFPEEVPFDAREYWEHRLTVHTGLAGVGYKRLGRSYNAWCYRLRSEVFRRLVLEWHLTGRGLDVLDVGSGTGHYVREWLLAGARSVTASDLTNVATERLRAAFPNVPVRQLDITEESVSQSFGQFDIVSAFDILFHIVDDAAYERAFRNCFALCRPGGYLVFSENFLHGPRETKDHMVSRSLDEIEHVLRRAGFVSLERKPMFVVMNHPTDVRNRLAGLAWIALVGFSVVCDRFGGIIGRLLFPFERRLVRSVIEGPSTEIMICRRPHSD
jgi:2-polyprenyl-3-methyl-5-hydroxy-6-metoxy-1,4-benzoquinol methylase